MKANVPHLSASCLFDLFELDGATGALTWKVRPVDHFTNAQSCRRWNLRFAGTLAGSVTKRGYRRVTIDARSYAFHRVVFAMHNGRWPEDEIDHINRVKLDNTPTNLRDCTASVNMLNRGPWKRTKK